MRTMMLRITDLMYPTLIKELGIRVTSSINLENAYPADWCEVEIRSRAKAATDKAYVAKLVNAHIGHEPNWEWHK